MKTEPIITEDFIDEEQAKDYLEASYEGLDLLPKIPEKLSKTVAAAVLNVSEPTIQRMVQTNEIKLEKQSILAYIQAKMLVNRPLKLEITPQKSLQIAPNNPK